MRKRGSCFEPKKRETSYANGTSGNKAYSAHLKGVSLLVCAIQNTLSLQHRIGKLRGVSGRDGNVHLEELAWDRGEMPGIYTVLSQFFLFSLTPMLNMKLMD